MKDRRLLQARMETLWHPRRVAMIGATNSVMKWGFIILARLLHEGFAGEVFPVNPREDLILGKKVYRSILDAPGEIDLAIIVTPAVSVLSALQECAQKGVPAAVVITSGFSEVGALGRRMEEEIVSFGRRAGMALVGPNTMGTYSAPANFNCLMAPISPLAGKAGCIAQSGNVGTHMLFSGKLRGFGFNKFVSSGNEGDLTFEDYLWWFGRDPEINAVVGYLEGLEPASGFMEVAAEVTRKKPVILYKGGRTAPGAKAAASHTGALAGDAALFRKAMRQAGVILADTNKEVVELAQAMELRPVPQGNRIGVLTRGGGWGVITTDACAEAGLEIARLAESTLARIDKILPSYWSHSNPVDMVAVISNQAYLDCLEIILADPGVDAVIALGANAGGHVSSTLQAMQELNVISAEKVAEFERGMSDDAHRFVNGLRRMIMDADKPVLTVGRWAQSAEWEDGLMMIGEPEEAAAMMTKMVEYGQYLKRVARSA